jgi:hypothetical protein
MSDEKTAVRAAVFGHLAGMILAPVVKALWDRRVFDLFDSSSRWVSLDQVIESTHGNRGYLHVALRLLTSYGWLKQAQRVRRAPPYMSGTASRRTPFCASSSEDGPCYALTSEGEIALKLAPRLYAEAISFLPIAVFLEDFLLGRSHGSIPASLQILVGRVKESWGIGPADDKVHGQIRTQLDGIVIGPAMVALARAGIFEQLERGAVDPKSIAANQTCLNCLLDLLATQGWMAREQNRVRLTSCGLYAAQIAPAYGVTASYLPLFTVVSTLLYGNARIPRIDENGVELFVNRAMNVWGSGGAHRTYFKKVDDIIVEIFNRPIERQPRGICDMGCGDGSLLEHLYFVVKNQTARGSVLDQHPLVVVGADFNKVARRVSTQTLRKARIPAFHVIPGDINRPAQLAGDLEKLGHDIHDLLHVRSFLDHNRPYVPPANYVKGDRKARSTGAFAHLGDEIPADELEENLVRHLRRWAPYVGRFGLLLLELHTLPPEVTAANLEKTPAVAYDGTHGFSDQYLVELPVFLDCAREAGLVADPRFQAKFPPSDLATISVNYFTAP